MKAYRRQLSLVAQESSLFHGQWSLKARGYSSLIEHVLGSIKENILLGVDPSTVSDEQLHQACRDASIHDFIVSLPEGFNTAVGSRGISLSGGQKQRVSIARALIRNPKILLLDEATSSLDPENEKLVQEALERASKGRTMVVVAHKLSTVRNADVIFVFGDGKILEREATLNYLNGMESIGKCAKVKLWTPRTRKPAAKSRHWLLHGRLMPCFPISRMSAINCF